MGKFSLREKQMSATTFVNDASSRAKWLISRECRGPGDTRNAMDRVSRRYGIPYSVLWSLRYRPPNDILVSVYFAIIQAHEAECDRQARLLEHERALTSPKTWAGRVLMRAAAALDCSEAQTVDDGGAK